MSEQSAKTESRLQQRNSSASLHAVADTQSQTNIDDFVRQLNRATDFHKLLDVFISNVRKSLPCDGIEYEESSIKLYLLDGDLMQQSCHYNLSYEGQDLGRIRFTRDDEFREDELVMLETLLAGLVMPLRNSLRYQQAVHVAQRDELTGLRNGNYYYDNVDLEIERSNRYHIPFSLVKIDIDNFKTINDTHGRAAGDAVLKQVAHRIEKQARSCDIVFRKGGDEFLVFLPNTDGEVALQVAERIKRNVLSRPCDYEHEHIKIEFSAGVVSVAKTDTAHNLMSRVDKALFHAKILGKNRIHTEAAPENVLREWM